ncbi:dCTP deaminase [Stenotrophomonas sp. NPDC101269]|uniref:dCTP deaminase n=1 Tax=Stenotrophomonas TaxID=40323 RepID=UPI003C2F1BAB
MTILSNEDIRRELQEGQLEMEGFHDECMRPCSYLLRLSPAILVRTGAPATVDTRKTDTSDLYESAVIGENGYAVHPNTLILAKSVERIRLGSSLFGELSVLSCYARIGLSLNLGSNHVAATYGADRPSIVTFEIVNVSRDVIVLYPGVKFCHLRLGRLVTPASISYRGIYASGNVITPSNFDRKPAR